jgi:hypothetical protein
MCPLSGLTKETRMTHRWEGDDFFMPDAYCSKCGWYGNYDKMVHVADETCPLYLGCPTCLNDDHIYDTDPLKLVPDYEDDETEYSSG